MLTINDDTQGTSESFGRTLELQQAVRVAESLLVALCTLLVVVALLLIVARVFHLIKRLEYFL
jgi:hypothetical protein